MGFEHYLFALFVFALAVGVVLLAKHGGKDEDAVEKADQQAREKKLMELYFEVDDMINALREYVEGSQARVEEQIRRVETDLQALRILREDIEMLKTASPQAEPDTQGMERTKPSAPPAEQWQQEAIALFDRGVSVDEIAERVGFSKGEVALALRLHAENPVKR